MKAFPLLIGRYLLLALILHLRGGLVCVPGLFPGDAASHLAVVGVLFRYRGTVRRRVADQTVMRIRGDRSARGVRRRAATVDGRRGCAVAIGRLVLRRGEA